MYNSMPSSKLSRNKPNNSGSHSASFESRVVSLAQIGEFAEGGGQDNGFQIGFQNLRLLCLQRLEQVTSDLRICAYPSPAEAAEAFTSEQNVRRYRRTLRDGVYVPVAPVIGMVPLKFSPPS